MNQQYFSTIILGGGFVGLFTALHLNHQRYAVPTVLIDQSWSFTFKPLLYEFLSGEMNAQLIWARYDDLLKHSRVAFVRDRVTRIDLNQQTVTLDSGLHYHYQNLVLALGSVTGYLGVPGAEAHTFAFRTIEDVISLGRHLRDQLQRASQTEMLTQRQQQLTVAILGAGRAGVELAATLADLLPEWYAPLGGNIGELRIVVVQRGSEILKGDAEELRQTVKTALGKLTIPVDLMLEAEVKAVSGDTVELLYRGRKEILSADTIIWTTGTNTHPLIQSLPISDQHRDRHGRLQVTPTLQLPDYPEVFAAGDCAFDLNQSLPTIAQVAYQQGAAIAHNLKALSTGKQPSPAHVKLRGTLMKLGLADSVAEIFDRVEVKGKLGHLVRQATYVELLPTPARNFKSTTQWLSDEVFQQIVGL